MFTLFPNTTSPASAWVSQHSILVAIAVLSVASLVLLILFGRPGGDGASADDFGMDGDSGGDGCSSD